MTIQGRNDVELDGVAAESPVWSHENHGVAFYQFPLAVYRLSGQQDLLPVLVRQPLLDRFRERKEAREAFRPEPSRPEGAALSPCQGMPCSRGDQERNRNTCSPCQGTPGPSAEPSCAGEKRPCAAPPRYGFCPGQIPPPVCPGDPLHIRGQLRSFNNRSGAGRRLVLTVYVRELSPGEGTPVNTILLSGCLCKSPVFRHTPLGRSICDLMLAVPRRCGRADYLPVIAWGQSASEASVLCPGDPLSLEGRVQSRAYRKVTAEGVQERTAYEVSVMRLLDTVP